MKIKRAVEKLQKEAASLYVGQRIAFNHGDRASKSMRHNSVLSYSAMFNALLSSESDIPICSVCSSDVCFLTVLDHLLTIPLHTLKCDISQIDTGVGHSIWCVNHLFALEQRLHAPKLSKHIMVCLFD